MTKLMKADDEAGQATVRLFQNCVPQAVLGANDRTSDPTADLIREQASSSSPRERDRSDHLRKQVGRLEEEVKRLRERLEESAAKVEIREKEAFEKGREAGKNEELEQSGKRLSLLAENLANAQKQFVERQAEMEVLALGIAEIAIGKVLTQRSDRSEQIGDAISAQMARLKDKLILSTQVSVADFPNDAELDALKARFPQLDMAAQASLSSGECRMNLKLGQLDLGIPGQWTKIQELFAELAEDRLAEA